VPLPGKILTAAVSPTRQCAAVSTAREVITVPEQDPTGWPSLSRRFTSTTDDDVEQTVPWRIVVETEVVPPMTLHAATPEPPDPEPSLGEVGGDPLLPPQPAHTDAATARQMTVTANSSATILE